MSLLGQARHALKRRLFVDDGRLDRALLVAGSGRSGTTWLGDLLARPGSDRVMFEPFDRARLPLLGDWPPHRYLPREATDDRARAVARRVLCGRLRNRWVDQTEIPWRVRRRVIKDIRCNLMLGWLRRSFPSLPIAVLIRHPCAVAASRRKLGWASSLAPYLDQARLVDEHLRDVLPAIEGAATVFLRHVAAWCIEQRVALRQLKAGEACLVFYEELCDRGEARLAELVADLGLEHGAAQANLLRPSAMSHPGSAVRQGRDRVSAWRREVEPAEITSALRLVEAFGLHELYGEEDRPQIAAASVLARCK